MLKWIINIFFFIRCFSVAGSASAQDMLILKGPANEMVKPHLDSIRKYFFRDPEIISRNALKVFAIGDSIDNYQLKSLGLQIAGEAFRMMGDFPKSLDMQFAALRLNRQYDDKDGEAFSKSFLGFTLLQLEEFRAAKNILLPAALVLGRTTDTIHYSFTLSNLASCYTQLGIMDSAKAFNEQSVSELNKINKGQGLPERGQALRQLVLLRIGEWYEKRKLIDSANLMYRQVLYYARLDNISPNGGSASVRLAENFLNEQNLDSAEHFARQVLTDKQRINVVNAAELMRRIKEMRGELDSALYFSKMSLAINNSLYGAQKFRQIQLIMLGEQKRQFDEESIRMAAESRQRTMIIAGVAIVLLALAMMQFRSNRQKKLINRRLEEQRNSLQQALTELKQAQSQLIQSEKMASLGEMTAGIAHEIQNPLNFVNNFSEVNTELIAEMKKEIAVGNYPAVKIIADDLESNMDKITEHGKRADSIVKSMLLHSRTSSNQREMTDINALVEEYVRLAFHGMRAKDKTFNAKLITSYDRGAGSLDLVPQDIGRVLLNLLNNAFYAVNEKRKSEGNGYEPEVSLETKRSGERIQISVADNGKGIPENLQNKIFQPFFTTKPTGEGTGLGLSLSYDIVKAHGGTLSVSSTEKKFTQFIIELPVMQGTAEST